MIRIAICDDNNEELDELINILNQYQTDIKIDSFDKATEIIKSIEMSEHFDIFILDMLMPQYNGIEIGRIIRDKGIESPIIYTTSTTDYALKAYGVRAIRYLLKPVQKQELFEALDFAKSLIKVEENRLIIVKTKIGIQQISYENIIYVENVSRAMKFALQDDSEIISVSNRTSFESSLSELLQAEEFVQPHKSFVVNMNYIKQFSNTQLTLNNQKIIPISRSNMANVKSRYLKYLTREWRG